MRLIWLLGPDIAKPLSALFGWRKILVFNVLEVMTHLSVYLRIKNPRNCVSGTAHKLCSPDDSGASGFLLFPLKYPRIYPLIPTDM